MSLSSLLVSTPMVMEGSALRTSWISSRPSIRGITTSVRSRSKWLLWGAWVNSSQASSPSRASTTW